MRSGWAVSLFSPVEPAAPDWEGARGLSNFSGQVVDPSVPVTPSRAGEGELRRAGSLHVLRHCLPTQLPRPGGHLLRHEVRKRKAENPTFRWNL